MSWKDKLEAQRADPHGLAGWLVARLLLLQPAARARTRWAVSLLELKPADRVLDVGIGPGYSTGLIAATVPEGLVVGVDRSALMTAIARRRLRRYLRLRKVTLVCADVADLPRFDVSFDKVVSVDALNLESESGALSRVRERNLTHDLPDHYHPHHRVLVHSRCRATAERQERRHRCSLRRHG